MRGGESPAKRSKLNQGGVGGGKSPAVLAGENTVGKNRLVFLTWIYIPDSVIASQYNLECDQV